MKEASEHQPDITRARDQLGHLAWVLDDMFRIPGLNWRFGLDSLLGLIPGAGDVVGAALGLLLIFRALQYRLPFVIVLRMVVNSLIDILVGAVPLAGDVFDFVWKSNAMNMKLFQQYATDRERSTKRHWLYIGIIALVFAAAFIAVGTLTFFSLKKILSWGF